MSDYSLIAKTNNNDTFLKNRTQDVINRNALLTRSDNSRSFSLQNAVDYNEARFKNDFTTSLTAVNNKYDHIKELYGQFYTNGISYDKDGNPVQGADATDYADRYQFAEFLHELYPDLSVDYFMKNADDFIYKATGVKADVKTYWDHIGNIWNASWANAGNSIGAVMKYFDAAMNDKFGTKDFENTKEEMAKKTAVSGANYRKDLGDEKYDSLIQKMFAGTIEQSPQMAMVAGMTILSLATGGISGTGGLTGLLAMKNMVNANKVAKGFRIGAEAFNFFFSGLMDAGDFMTEVSQAGASDEAAYAAGLAILASTGFLETWGDDSLLKPVDKIAKSIFNYKDNKVVNQAVKSAWKIIGEGFVNKAKQVGTSEITETVQEEVEYLASVFAKQLVYYYEKEHGNLLDKQDLGITKEQVIDSIVETAKQTMLSTPFMTLGSSVIASGVDLAFGPTSAQWTPKKYMNKEGATHVRGTQEFVEFGEGIVDPNIKEGKDGKPNPIKAHTVGGYTFIDGKISQAQYDLLTSNKNKAVFTTESESKVTKKDATTLKSEANDTGTTLKADVADSYLAAIERDGNLKEYGYETKGKISERNDGDATTLYITLKDTEETVKIELGEENSEKEKLDSLKDFTNVEFHSAQELHHIQASEDDIKKVEERQEKFRKKQEEEERKEEEKRKQKEAKDAQKTAEVQKQAEEDTSEDPVEDNGETSSDIPKVAEEDDDDFDVFAGTAKEGQKTSVRASIDKAKHNNGEPIVGNSYTYFANKYKPKEEETSDGKKKKTKKNITPIAESHVYLNENGQEETKDIHKATIMEMRSADGTVVERVEIKNLGDAKIKDLLKYTKDGGSNSLDSQTKTFKNQNKKKNEAYADAGVTPNSTEPVRKVSEVKAEEQQVVSTKAENKTETEPKEKTNDSPTEEETLRTEQKTVQEATIENETEETPKEEKEEKAEENSIPEEETGPVVTPVTAKEIDDLVEEIEKTQKGSLVSKYRARQMALLAKGLKDIFEFIGKKFDFSQAGKFINSSLFAKADSLNKVLDTFIDSIFDHPNGKSLFKILTNNAKFTKQEKAILKQKMISYLKGNSPDLSETARNHIDQLYGPLKGALNITETLNEEDKRLAEQVKREEQKVEEQKVEEQKEAPKQEEKTEAEKEIDKRKKNYETNANNLALRAWKYCETQATLNRESAKKNPKIAGERTKAAEMFEQLAEKYKAYYEDIKKNGYDAALKFAISWDARTAQLWAMDNKTAEWKTAGGITVHKKLNTLPSTEELIAEKVNYALKYYKQVSELQVRRNGESSFMGVSAYELGKLNLALNEGLREEIDKIVDEIITGIPSYDIPEKGDNYLRNENGEIVLDVNKKPKYIDNPKSQQQLNAEWEKAKRDAEERHILDVYEYLYLLVEAGGEDVMKTFADNTASLPLEGSVSLEEKEVTKDGQTTIKKTAKVNITPETQKNASLIVEDMKPVIAYALLGKLITENGTPFEAVQKYRNGNFNISSVLVDFSTKTAWLIDGAHKDSLLYMDYANYWKNVQAMKKRIGIEDDLKNQFIGTNALENLKEKYPIYYDNYEKALQLREAGTPIEEVWEQTGWFWGVDGQWRMEIRENFKFNSPFIEKMRNNVDEFFLKVKSQSKGLNRLEKTLNAKYEKVPLSQFFYDETLYSAYPKLKDVVVSLIFDHTEKLFGGNADENTISIYIRSSFRQIFRTLSHEIQHIIQEEERFALGGNIFTVEDIVDRTFKDEKEKIKSISRDAMLIKRVKYFLNSNVISYTSDTLRDDVVNDLIGKNEAFLSGDFTDVKTLLKRSYLAFMNDFLENPLLDVPQESLSANDIKTLLEICDSLYDRLQNELKNDANIQKAMNAYDLWEYEVLDGGNVDDTEFEEVPITLYLKFAGEVEARNTSERWDKKANDFPLSTQDTESRFQLVVNPAAFEDRRVVFSTDSEVLKYQTEGISEELSATPFKQSKGREIDYLNYKSSFEFDNNTGKYYINANNVYNELLTVMTATYPEGTEVDMPALRQQAKLASIFLSSLSEDAQDAIVRRSSDTSFNNGKLLTDRNEALLRLFFTPDELNGLKLSNKTKGATFSNWAKIFLTSMSDENTVTHEIGHILWTLDPSFRDRAVKEYKEYFGKDTNGDSIRAVVAANPENFGGFSADDIIKALKRLTEDDYNFDQKKDLMTEEAIQYMFQTWWQGKDTLEYAKGVKGLFERAAAYIKKVAERIMNFFGVDILHETNNKVFSPLFTDAQKAQEFMQDMKMKDVDFHQFDRPEAKTLTVSQNGNVRVMRIDGSLVLTHSISSRNLDIKLQSGGNLYVPSMALTEPTYTPFYGAVHHGFIFFGNKSMVERYAQNGWLYDRDLYSPSHPSIVMHYETSKKKILNYLDKLNNYFGDYIKNFDPDFYEAYRKEEGNSFSWIRFLFNIWSDDPIMKSLRHINRLAFLFPDSSLSKQDHDFEKDYDVTKTYAEFLEGYESTKETLYSTAVEKKLISGYKNAKAFFDDIGQPEISEKPYIAQTGKEYTPENIMDYYHSSGRLSQIDYRYHSDERMRNLNLGFCLSAINLFSLREAHANEWKFHFGDPFDSIKDVLLTDDLWFKVYETWNDVFNNILPSVLNEPLKYFNTSFNESTSSGIMDFYKQKLADIIADWLTSSAYPNVRDMDILKDKITHTLPTVSAVPNAGIRMVHVTEEKEKMNLESWDLFPLYDAIQNALELSKDVHTQYGEAKPAEIVNLRDFSFAFAQPHASKKFIKRLREDFGLKVLSYDELVQEGVIQPLHKEKHIANQVHEIIDNYTHSVKGAADQLLFQTVGSVAQELAADSQPVQKKAQLVHNYEELMYRHVKASLNADESDTKQVFADWKKSVKDFMATEEDIDRLQKHLEETGIFHNIDIQNNLSSSMRDEIKSDITKRLAYSREDYIAWAKNIERVRNNLRGADGKPVSADSPAVKEALYTLYGYREVKGKTAEGKTTTRLEATGLLSRVFAADKKGGSKWGSMLSKFTVEIQKRAEALDKMHPDDERYKSMQYLAGDADAIVEYFLNKDKWSASKAKESNNVLKGTSKEYDKLSYKLDKTSTYEIYVQDIEAFLTTLVDFDGQPFIAKVNEDNFGLSKDNDGNSVSIASKRLAGPLVDLVNFAHVDESAIKSGLNKANSLHNVDEAFAWAAYNNYRNNKTYNKGNNTLEEDIYLLDKVTLDYIGALELLKNNVLMKGIYEKGLSGEQLEMIERSLLALKEEADKRLEALEGYKLQLSNISYDELTRTIQKGLNLLNIVKQTVVKKVGPSGLSEAEVNKLKKNYEKVLALNKELEKNIKEDKGVLSDENETEELKKIRKELFASDAELAKSREEVQELRRDLKFATERSLRNLAEILRNPEQIPTDPVQEFLEEHEKLKKQVQGYQLACRAANTKAYEAEKALHKDTVLADAMLKDFDKYGLSTLFTNTKKALRNVAVNKSTGEVNEKLTLLMKAIYSKPKKGTIKELDVNKALNFKGIYSSDISEKADEYYEHAEQLRLFVAKLMLGERTRKNVHIVTSTIDNLNAQQLVELESLISTVAADSKEYTKEKFKAHTEYRNKWIDAINKEIHAFAVSHNIDDTLLTEEDRIGIDSSKKDKAIGEIIEQFTLQSKKYRNTYPTLYSFIFGGGLDHRGLSTGWGLNEAQNKLYDGEDVQKGEEKIHRDGYTERAKSLQKLIAENLSDSIFFKGKITKENFNDVINLVKRGYKTTLGESDINEEDRKSVGLKVQEIQFGNNTKFISTIDEEEGSPAMREVVRYIADQETEYLNLEKNLEDLEDSLEKLEEKLEDATTKMDSTVSAIAGLTEHLEYVESLDTSSLNEEELRDRKKLKEGLKKYIEELAGSKDEKAKNVNAALERVEKKKEQINKLKQRQQINSQKGGTKSLNTNTYTTQELLGIYLIVRQQGGINHLVYHPTEFDDKGNLMAASSKTNNLSIGNVIWVVQQFENPNGIYAPLKKIADSIVDIMSSSFEAVKDMKFYLSDGATTLEKIPYYFTFTVQDDAAFFDLPEINIELAEAKADGKIDVNARVSDTMTKERQKRAEAPLNLNVLDTVFNQLYKQEYYVAFGRELKDLTELLDNGRFLTELITAHGRSEAKTMYTSLAKYVNAIGNGNKTIESSKIDSVVRFFTNQTAAGALCFSLPNVLMQFPTILVCKDDPNIGWKGLFTGMAKAVKDEEVTRLSPQIREMVNGYVDNIRKSDNFGTLLYRQGVKQNKDWMQKAGLNLERGIKTYQRWGLKLLDKSNIYAAKAMWYAYFDGVKKEKESLRKEFDTQEAFDWMCANEATQRVMDITPIQQAKDNSEVYNNKGQNAWLSQVLLFTQQTGKMMNRYIGAYNEGKHNAWTTSKWISTMGKMLTISVFLWLANGFVKGSLFKDRDDEEEDTWEHICDAWDFVNTGMGSDVVGWDIIFNNDDYGGLQDDIASLIKALSKSPDERTDNQLLNAFVYTMNEATFGVLGGSAGPADKVYRSFRDLPDYGVGAFTQLYNNNWAKHVEKLIGDN